jgi:hypothetical protein
MPWKSSRINPKQLKQANDQLSAALIETRTALQIAERHRVGLEVMLAVRGEKIDQLSAQVDRLRHENGKLELEAEHLAQLFRENAAPAK